MKFRFLPTIAAKFAQIDRVDPLQNKVRGQTKRRTHERIEKNMSRSFTGPRGVKFDGNCG